MKFTFLLISLFLGLVCWSQPATNNGAYFEHTVESGQTLYGISKKYNVSIDQIVSINPGVDSGLRLGQVIRIPHIASAPSKGDKYVVKSGDTIFGIARAHGITAEQLMEMNQGIMSGLVAGDSLIVPTLQIAGERSISADNHNSTHTYDVVVMLPFYTTTKDSLMSRDIRLRDAATAMYRGIMMACDSLESAGLKAKFHIIDVVDDKASIQSVLKSKEMKGADLVIGPLFKDLVPDVAAWCATNNAHMVIPVQQPNRVLLNAPALSKSVPGSVTQWMSITRYAHKNFSKENVVLIDSKIIDDRKVVEAFKEEWVKLTKDSLRKVVVCDDLNNLKIAQLLPAGKCVVAAPTNDKKVIAAIWKALGNRTDVDVIGMEAWDDMDAISTEMRNKFHVTYPKPTFVDEEDEVVLKWKDAYRKRYKSDPIDFSYVGYDVALYFGWNLLKFGKVDLQASRNTGVNTLSGKFEFFRTTSDSGFENAAVNIIRTDNYQLHRAN
jgi:LysM repeat protein/ABC-type branched-subunit amino acid transport system substrate-binding protein